MRSFGFDYFVKRGELLTEMAPPTKVFLGVGPEFNNLFSKLIKDQHAQGVTDAGTRQVIVYRFILDTLNEFGNLMTNEDGELMTSLEIAKSLEGKTNHGGVKAAAIRLVNQHAELARNPKVMEFLANPENIQRFKDYTGLGPNGKSTSNRRVGKENELVDVTGKGISDYEQSTSKVRDLIMMMNKVMGNRKKRKLEQSGQLVPETPTGDYNPNVDYAYAIVDAIETILDSKNEYSQEVKSGEIELDELPREVQVLVNSKTAESDLNYLKGMYEKTITDKTGSTPEEFQTFLGKLKGIKGMTPERASVFDLLLQEIEDLESHELLNIETSESQYPGYDPDVVAKYLDSPDKQEAFDDWYRSHTQWRKAKNEKLEQLLINKMIDLQIKLNPKLQGANNDEIFINPEIQQYMGSIQGYQKKLDSETDPKKEEFYQAKIEDLQKKIADVRQRKNQPQVPEEQEEDIMDTFVESLQSNYYKPKGQFVERGFKKYPNYAQWLMNND